MSSGYLTYLARCHRANEILTQLERTVQQTRTPTLGNDAQDAIDRLFANSCRGPELGFLAVGRHSDQLDELRIQCELPALRCFLAAQLRTRRLRGPYRMGFASLCPPDCCKFCTTGKSIHVPVIGIVSR